MKLTFLQALLFSIATVLLLGAEELKQQEGESDEAYVARLEPLAASGDAVAIFEIGNCYRYGTGYKKDETQALDYYKKSAELGYDKALARVGYFYSTGTAVEENPTIACEYYKKAAALGNYSAAYNLGLAYRKGRGVEKDIDKSHDWFEIAFERGDLDDKIEIAKSFVAYSGNTSYETKYLKILEGIEKEHGLEKVQKFLGICYMQQPSYEPKKAFYYLKKAAEKGNVSGKYGLALMYLRGDAVGGINEEKGFKLIIEAAETDEIPTAPFVAAMTYLARRDLTRENIDKAFVYLNRAVALGVPDAQYTLGWIMANGQYMKIDRPGAIPLLEKAAEGGYHRAYMVLAEIYYQGEDYGVPQDMDKVNEVLKKAAELGDNSLAKRILLHKDEDPGIYKRYLGVQMFPRTKM